MSAVLLAGCFTASAQQETATKEVFNPHWFVQAQMGGQYTLGEVKFGDLLSLNAQVAGGYKFSPVWALRLAVSGWQSKGGTDFSDYKTDLKNLGVQTYKYNYIAPTLDISCNITNWILGYNPNRIVDAGILAGLGANIGWNNGEAADLQKKVHPNGVTDRAHYMSLLWDKKTRMVGKMGIFVDFHVSRRVDLGIEVNANTLSDSYNSKKADNFDWYFNALAGIKVNIGKVSKRVPVKASEGVGTNAEPVIVEKIVEKPVEKIVEKIVYKEPEATKREPLRRDIFFNIRGSEVSKTEMPKVEDVVAYMNKYPEAKVSITGYADKGTGNPKINVGYAKKRAQMVADILTKKYGIAASRITVDSKGDTVQPYEQNDLNRVSICIAE